ncbi:hypothetical protein QBC35DRAFT_165988 [Podospora australis]|uniref:Uncharacterized protein n=1 Tax=Podospora australis TaxID=1536484 RepID=A0AAN6X596_9PEZI|nr:hypothetical protein QBC35DRAFT_165988 [Podospora australis]
MGGNRKRKEVRGSLGITSIIYIIIITLHFRGCCTRRSTSSGWTVGRTQALPSWSWVPGVEYVFSYLFNTILAATRLFSLRLMFGFCSGILGMLYQFCFFF